MTPIATKRAPSFVLMPARTAACIGAIAALFLCSAIPAAAEAQGAVQPASGGKAIKHRHAHRAAGESRRARARARARRRARRLRAHGARARGLSHRARHGASVSAATPLTNPKTKAAASTSDTLEAGFEEGLLNWNTAGVGEAIPTVVGGEVRSGLDSGRVVLTGTQGRSELILGGNGGASTDGMVEFSEGAEYFYAFSFDIDSMVYGHPGAHNLIMQFKGNDEGSPAFGLQLWDYEGDNGEYAADPKGLWSAGTGMGGDRFLAPVAEHVWHDVVIHFKASAVGAGYYEVFLDGQLIDARGGVSMIAPGATYAYIKNGLYRNGAQIPGTSEVHFDDAKLGPTWGSVQPD